MDQHKLSQLESLYTLFLQNNSYTMSELMSSLKCEEVELNKWLNKLEAMGLEFAKNNESVVLISKVEPLNAKQIQAQLSKWAIKKPLNFFFSTSSTNKRAQQSHKPSYFITDHQYSGRGRGAKKWLSPLGQCLAFSLTHQFDKGLAQISGLNIAIGVAIIDTFKHFNDYRFGLKWPNDVLSEAGKVAGILIEVSGNSRQCTAVIGIGLNWCLSSDHLSRIKQKSTNAQIDGVSRSQFLCRLIVEIERTLFDFSQQQLNGILDRWDQNDLLKGQSVRIKQAKNDYQADYIGIDSRGCLLVKRNNRSITLASGEVSLRDYFVNLS